MESGIVAVLTGLGAEHEPGVSRIAIATLPDGGEAVPAHILCDLAVGGKWPGEPTTKDPMTLQFDYVRVYQEPGRKE